jgi:hypothetical protein
LDLRVVESGGGLNFYLETQEMGESFSL